MNLTETGRAFYHQSVGILEDVLEAELAFNDREVDLIQEGSDLGIRKRARAFVDFLVKRFTVMPYWDFCLQKCIPW